MILGTTEKLSDKLGKKGLAKKVAFNVITKENLRFLWLYPRTRDSVETSYYAVVSSLESPDIYFKRRLGNNSWGINLSWGPDDGPGIKGIKDNLQKIREQIKESDLIVEQEYIPILLNNS